MAVLNYTRSFLSKAEFKVRKLDLTLNKLKFFYTLITFSVLLPDGGNGGCGPGLSNCCGPHLGRWNFRAFFKINMYRYLPTHYRPTLFISVQYWNSMAN